MTSSGSQAEVIERHASPYRGQRAVLATMHGKEAVIAPALHEVTGLDVFTAQGIDTDALGTFTGEVERKGSILDAAIAKARMGMSATGHEIGIASEGSYGPHPSIPFMPGGIELMVLVDDSRGLMLSEHLVENVPVYDHTSARTAGDLDPFLKRIGFPGHAVIVKPAETLEPSAPIQKGIRGRDELARAVALCAKNSRNGLALIQTDMRAHMNPTRMQSLKRLALALGRRVATPCPVCRSPGFGQVDAETGLPCEACGCPSELVGHLIFGCAACTHRERRPRPDGRTHADPGQCPHCNP